MGLRNRTLIKDPAYFFVTIVTLEHYPFLDHSHKLQYAVECLLDTSIDYDVNIISYVIMNNHIHFLAYFSGGGVQLSRFVSSVKGRIRKGVVGNKRMWELRFDDKLVRNEKMMVQDIDYIHYNPVKAGLVKKPEDYNYSSAAIWVGKRKDDRVTVDIAGLSTAVGRQR